MVGVRSLGHPLVLGDWLVGCWFLSALKPRGVILQGNNLEHDSKAY